MAARRLWRAAGQNHRDRLLVAALTFSENELDALTVRKALFRLILSRAVRRLSDPSDLEELEVAQAMDGLAFDLMGERQRGRMAQAVLQAVQSLKDEIAAGKALEEPVLPGIDEKLDELHSFLSAQRRRDRGSGEV
jgi:hypothetical protein